jgi:hypothetical protein
MKILVVTIAVLLNSFQVFGQKRTKADPRDVQIDSLTQVSKDLTLQLDSVSGELVKYVSVYNTLREKVLHYNFDPTKTAFLIDSLKASRDSASALLLVIPKSTSSTDSISRILTENKILKTRIDSLLSAQAKGTASIPLQDIEKANAVSNLKQLKELLDAKIITDEEFLILKKKYVDKL